MNESTPELDVAVFDRAPPEPEGPPLVTEPVEFWFIWTKTGRVPRYAHNTYQSAEAECERLARLNPGKKFIILEAVSKRHLPPPVEAQAEAA